MQTNKSIFIILGALLFLSLISVVNAAYFSYGSYYGGSSPAALLDNEWVMFIVFFCIFFATIFASLGKVFHDKPAIPAIVAVALAFLVSASIQRDWYFLQKPILFWALILSALLVIVTLFRAMGLRMGGGAVIFLALAALIGYWPFMDGGLQWNLRSSLPLWLIDILDASAGWGLIVFVVAILTVMLKQHRANQKE